jgi:6-phosphogluconolactonase (cycloisomerase 2 family)
LVALAVSGFTSNAAEDAEAALPDRLTPLGCLASGGTGCAPAPAVLDAPQALEVSHDGEHVYAVGTGDALLTATRVPSTGGLRFPAKGCTVGGAVPGCVGTGAFEVPRSVELSPTGDFLLVAAQESDAVHVFSLIDNTVDGEDGIPAQVFGTDKCRIDAASSSECGLARAMNGPNDASFSPDGDHAYVPTRFDNTVVTFSVDGESSTPTIEQPDGPAGCIAEIVNDADDCADGRGLVGAIESTVSPDGANVYVAALQPGAQNPLSTIAVFDRDPGDGALTQRAGTDACVSNKSLSGCRLVSNFTGAVDVEVSPDGAHVYAADASGDGILAFSRDQDDGGLAPLPASDACVRDQPAVGCEDGRGLDQVSDIEISPEGDLVVAASQIGDAVTLFKRDPVSGDLDQVEGVDGCISASGAEDCAELPQLDGATGVAASEDGAAFYASGQVTDAIVAFARGDRPTPPAAAVPGTAAPQTPPSVAKPKCKKRKKGSRGKRKRRCKAR